MEAFIRSWGATDTSDNDFSTSQLGWTSTSSGFDIGGLTSSGIQDHLRMDRSASFDDESSIGRGTAADNINNNNSAVNDLQARHRRIASTGGDRLPINNFGAASQYLFVPPSPGVEVNALVGGGDGGEPNPNINNMMLNDGMSALHDAARITDWEAVAALSESNPESAKYVGPDGWNALHHACDRRCPHVHVIDSLLNAYPEALIKTNDKGWTPLHRACRNKTPKDVVKLLLRKYPDMGKRVASMRCNDGRSALHYALMYDAPEGVVELLLQADPAAVLDEDRDGVSPLGKVWDRYANSFEGRAMLAFLRPLDGNDLGEGGVGGQLTAQLAKKTARAAMERNKALQNNWNKVNLLLRAYFGFSLQEENNSDDASDSSSTNTENTRRRKWRVLHAVSSIKCHSKLFLLARALYADQAAELDENDLFVSGRGGGDNSSSSSSDPQSPQLSQRTALHFAAMSPLTGAEGLLVVKDLLRLNPNAASHVDGYGSLPLHLICQNVRRLHWANFGARDIYNAYTEASSCIDGSGRTPLHCVSASLGQYMSFYPRPVTPAGLPDVSMEESVIRNLVEVNGAAASIADNTGRLPFHYIAEGLENWSTDVQSILNAYPAAASTRAGPTTSNQLPLHMAASSPDARPSLIMGIVQANPRAASIVDGTGRLPLHLAVDSGRTTWDNGIDSIYTAYTLAISIQEESSRRWTVLHTAAASQSAGRSLIEHIISLAPDTASVVDAEGRYPLHIACDNANRSWEDGGIKAIFDADPSAAYEEDANGLIPFITAALKSCSVSTTSDATNTSSIIVEDEDGENDEVESAAARELEDQRADDNDNGDDLDSLELLFILLRTQPSIVHKYTR